MQTPQYIVVEGPIGVGKTTLVTGLSDHMRARTVLESFEDNPFLPLFYQDRERYAFQTEVFFMLSRFKQQEDMGQLSLFDRNIVADYLFGKTRLFASMTLSDQEFRLYEKMFQALESQILQPDLVIYLSAPLEILLSRIGRRGRPMEQNMDPDYLSEVCQTYARYFSQYTKTPLLMVDTTSFNFADDSEALSHLFDAIDEMSSPLAHLVEPNRLEYLEVGDPSRFLF